LKHDGVDDAEDGAVGADAKCHRRDHGHGVAAVLAQTTEPVADVLDRGFRKPREPGIANVFLDAFEAAKELARGTACGDWRHAARDVLRRLHLEMKGELGVELTLHARAAKERTEANEPAWHSSTSRS
jgi:hypothetical protein